METKENKEMGRLEETEHEPPLIEMEEEPSSTLRFRIDSTPPLVVTIFTAIQHVLLCIPGCLFTASAVSDVVCIPYSHPVRATMFCGTMFMAGICTFMQVAFGVRLPILQGPAGSFLVPLLALKSNSEWTCSEEQLNPQANVLNGTSNSSLEDTATDDLIYDKLQKISGALMMASILETSMGALGLMGLILRFIGPITVAVTISLIGISLIKLPIEFARASYPIGLGCLVLILIFILYCQSIRIPLPRCGKNRKKKGKRSYFPIFELVPILVGLMIMWFISWILTRCGVFTDDKSSIYYYARTDAKLDVISWSPWFKLSYPGMFGPPKLNVAIAIGFIFSGIASMVESVGDYYAAHNACEVARPPKYAISRGILVEGVGTLLSGAVGVGHATTSFSGNIAILILSKNASRAVMYTASLILILLSMFGKVGAVLTTIPNPILGGISMLVLSTLVCIGLSNLRHVELATTRNLLVVGIPLVCGIGVPKCVEMYPGIIDTGIGQVTQLLTIVIGNPMFLGGILAVILDNTVPGSLASRGMVHTQLKLQKSTSDPPGKDDNLHVYSWPCYPKLVQAVPFLSYLPFMPPNTTSSYDLQPNDVESTEPINNGVV